VRLAPAVLQTASPAIVEVYEMARRHAPADRPVLHLGQAIPDLPPPAPCLEALRAELGDRSLHVYSPDQGLPDLREAIAADYRARLGVEVDPDAEILVTAGANHAMFQALLATAAPGDRIVLPAPCYFNHAMALQLLGLEEVGWPMAVRGERFGLDLDRLPAGADGPRTAGVVCVNPNNPTGAVYPADEIRALIGLCRERDWILYYDEVYRLLAFGDEAPLHPFQVEGGRERTVVVGSFSKLFGMTGWRVGYLIAPPAVLRQLLKVQDTTVICAPVPGQRLAADCLRRFPDYPAGYREELRRRVALLASVVREIPGLRWRQPAGALFTMIGYDEGRPSRELAEALIRSEGVVVIPGSAFGRWGERQLRVSFGFTGEGAIREAGERLARFFSGGRNR
jgi:aspartate/methionine/tyrosine aminotransferase